MKVFGTILLLCSAAISQQAAAPQSSKLGSDAHWVKTMTTVTTAHPLRVWGGSWYVECYPTDPALKDTKYECSTYQRRKAGAHSVALGKSAAEKTKRK
jgi:hypothetical protein